MDRRKGAHASVRILRASTLSKPPLRGVKKLHPLGRRRRESVGVWRPLTVYTRMSMDKSSLTLEFRGRINIKLVDYIL